MWIWISTNHSSKPRPFLLNFGVQPITEEMVSFRHPVSLKVKQSAFAAFGQLKTACDFFENPTENSIDTQVFELSIGIYHSIAKFNIQLLENSKKLSETEIFFQKSIFRKKKLLNKMKIFRFSQLIQCVCCWAWCSGTVIRRRNSKRKWKISNVKNLCFEIVSEFELILTGLFSQLFFHDLLVEERARMALHWGQKGPRIRPARRHPADSGPTKRASLARGAILALLMGFSGPSTFL